MISLRDFCRFYEVPSFSASQGTRRAVRDSARLWSAPQRPRLVGVYYDSFNGYVVWRYERAAQ